MANLVPVMLGIGSLGISPNSTVKLDTRSLTRKMFKRMPILLLLLQCRFLNQATFALKGHQSICLAILT